MGAMAELQVDSPVPARGITTQDELGAISDRGAFCCYRHAKNCNLFV
jgi:hypothetical protein